LGSFDHYNLFSHILFYNNNLYSNRFRRGGDIDAQRLNFILSVTAVFATVTTASTATTSVTVISANTANKKELRKKIE
jgi:phenylpyruvate tautomerase PptA (4-oxalocrotonate tautomerase family)